MKDPRRSHYTCNRCAQSYPANNPRPIRVYPRIESRPFLPSRKVHRIWLRGGGGMARRRYETRDRGKLSELQREQIRTLRSKEERAAGLERGRDWISFRGTKVHSRGRTPRYFCVLPLIGHARVMTAGSLCRIRVSITRPKSTRRFPETRGHPPARQVLRSPNYQLIFVFTALRCTFVTLAEHVAASWGGKFNFVPPPSRRRCPMAKNSRLPKGPVELVQTRRY